MKESLQAVANFMIAGAVAIFFGGLFLLLLGGIITWYVESRFGVEAAKSMWLVIGLAILGGFMVIGIFLGWCMSHRSARSGSNMVVDAMHEMAYIQKESGAVGREYARAYASEVKADNQIRVLDTKAVYKYGEQVGKLLADAQRMKLETEHQKQIEDRTRRRPPWASDSEDVDDESSVSQRFRLLE